MPQETQQKTFKFVKSPMEEINFRPPLGISAPSLDQQTKCFLQFRYQTNFPCHHQKLDRTSTPKPLRSPTIVRYSSLIHSTCHDHFKHFDSLRHSSFSPHSTSISSPEVPLCQSLHTPKTLHLHITEHVSLQAPSPYLT